MKDFAYSIRLQEKPINLNSSRPNNILITNVRTWVLSRWWECSGR